MPGKQIINPLGAFGYGAEIANSVDEFKSSGTITSKNVVAVGTDYRVAKAATDGTASLVRGVAIEAAVAGETVEVVTRGLAEDVPATGTVSAGDVLKRSVTTAGSVAATATPATGEAFAVAINASASNVVDIWVL